MVVSVGYVEISTEKFDAYGVLQLRRLASADCISPGKESFANQGGELTIAPEFNRSNSTCFRVGEP